MKNQLRECFEPIGPRANQKVFTPVEKLEECIENGVEISVWAQLMMSGKIRRMTTYIDEALPQQYLDRGGRKRYRRARYRLGREVSDFEYLKFAPKALSLVREVDRRLGQE